MDNETKSGPFAWCSDFQREVLARKFSCLSREQFEQFLAECDRLKLNPFAKQVGATVRHNATMGLPELVVWLPLTGMRSLAIDTGEHAGFDPVTYEWPPPLTDEELDRVIREKIKPRPLTASACVYRMIGGERRGFPMTAYWWESAPAEGTDEFWTEYPRLALAYRAEAYSLRAAFPRELGNLCLPGEVPPDGSSSPAGWRLPEGQTLAGPTPPRRGGQHGRAPVGRGHVPPMRLVPVVGTTKGRSAC